MDATSLYTIIPHDFDLCALDYYLKSNDESLTNYMICSERVPYKEEISILRHKI